MLNVECPIQQLPRRLAAHLKHRHAAQAHQHLVSAVAAFAITDSLQETDVLSIPWLNMSAPLSTMLHLRIR